MNHKSSIILKLVLLLMTILVQSGFSQQKQEINQAIEYVNHCNLYISATHYSVKDYNIKVLHQFKEPERFYDKDDFFELECSPGSIECSEKLNISHLNGAYQSVKNLAQIPELQITLKTIKESFDELTKLITSFENKTYTKSFFEDQSNIKKLESDLLVYKILIEQLTDQFQAFSEASTALFNENKLPNPLERTKKMSLSVKKAVDNFQNKDSQLIQKQLKEVEILIQESDLGADLEQMESFGDFSYTDNNETQERANIERMASTLLRIYDKEENRNYRYPTNYGIRTYNEVLDPEKHQKIYKIERLSTFFNDNTRQSIVKNYNIYMERANTPILKIIGIVLPFEIIQFKFEEPEIVKEDTIKIDVVPQKESTVFVREDIHSLSGAKTNNLVLLLDISTSMQYENRMENLKYSILHLIDLLRPEDQLTILTYANTTKLIFSSSQSNFNKDELKDMITNLKSSGGTKVNNALKEAYKYSNKAFIPNGNNKIIIATDGAFTLNNTAKSLLENDKIKMSVFYFKAKKSSKSEQKNLKKIAKIGKGSFSIIQNKQDAMKSLILEAKEQ